MADIITPTYIVMSSIVTVIALISGTRFLYVHKSYSELINKLEKAILNAERKQLEKDTQNDSDKSNDSEVLLKEFYVLLGFYKSQQNNNRIQGGILDFISLSLIIGSALLSINQIINDQSILNVIIIISISIPFINLANHFYILRKEPKLI